MLNTDRGLEKAAIWLAILVILTSFCWTFWALSAPAALWQSLADSELAAFASRNQLSLTGLLGLGGATFAYLLNGQRGRAERRHELERSERREGAVLASEAREIADACEKSARTMGARSIPLAQCRTELRLALLQSDYLLLGAKMDQIARLGSGASTAARSVRARVRHLSNDIDNATSEDAASAKSLAAQSLDCAVAARKAALVFDALAKGGPAASDRVRPFPAVSAVTLGLTDDTQAETTMLH